MTALTNQVASLNNEIQHKKFDKSEFENNDDKVKYFTGLPSYSILLSLFAYLELYIPAKPLLNKFQLLMLTLIHLRLNLPLQLLSYQFNVSVSTVSRYFLEMIDVMYIRMKVFIKG